RRSDESSARWAGSCAASARSWRPRFPASPSRSPATRTRSATGCSTPSPAGSVLCPRTRQLSCSSTTCSGQPCRPFCSYVTFFVGEMLRHLTESGGIYHEDGRVRYAGSIRDLDVPDGVRELVRRRLSRLSDDADRVLSCASVEGMAFDEQVVGATGDLHEAAL